MPEFIIFNDMLCEMVHALRKMIIKNDMIAE